MFTETSSRQYCQTIGEFLCRHPNGPSIVDIDQLSLLDIKQEAAMRAIVGLRRLGKTMTVDAVGAFDAEPGLVAQTYLWTHRDAIRRHLGRGSGCRPIIVRDVSELLADPAQSATLDLVEGGGREEIDRLALRAAATMNRDQLRRVLTVMRQVQVLKDSGQTPISPALRTRLSRLRRETRLPLDISLL